MVTFVAWKQSYSRFSKQLNFSRLQNSMKFVLLKFYLLCFVSTAFSHLVFILNLDFFPKGYLNVPTVNIHEKSRGSHLTKMYKHPKNNGSESICCNQSSDILERSRGDTCESE